jgi:hypothetical protein
MNINVALKELDEMKAKFGLDSQIAPDFYIILRNEELYKI